MRSIDSVTTFRALHAGKRVLLLPNVWDAATSALFAAAGAKAIATTSAGLAWACGFPDDAPLPRARLLEAVGSICRVAGDLPVSVDLEDGFCDDPGEVADLVGELGALGVAGINLEDGRGEPELLAAKIAAVKRRAADAGDEVFVNARTDVYLRGLASGDAAVRETIARLQRYAQAGADGVFAPALAQRDAIRRVAGAVGLPLNLMAVANLPPLAELFELGVRRVSAGSAIAEMAYGTAANAAASWLRDGDVSALFGEPVVDYAQTNALLQAAATNVPGVPM